MADKHIYLCLAHKNEAGEEQKYVKEAFDTHWVVPLGFYVSDEDVKFIVETILGAIE